MKNIILVGMPGSGKSTLGIILSKKIGYGYIDSDSVIVAREGKLLPELIEQLGNDGCLDVEAKVNGSICASRCVISTGGSGALASGSFQVVCSLYQRHFPDIRTGKRDR